MIFWSHDGGGGMASYDVIGIVNGIIVIPWTKMIEIKFNMTFLVT